MPSFQIHTFDSTIYGNISTTTYFVIWSYIKGMFILLLLIIIAEGTIDLQIRLNLFFHDRVDYLTTWMCQHPAIRSKNIAAANFTAYLRSFRFLSLNLSLLWFLYYIYFISLLSLLLFLTFIVHMFLSLKCIVKIR